MIIESNPSFLLDAKLKDQQYEISEHRYVDNLTTDSNIIIV